MILVAGATSHVGEKLIPMLIAKGYPVRALTRKPEKAEGLRHLGAEVVQGDVRDPLSLDRAMKGVAQVVDCICAPIPDSPGNNVKAVDNEGNRNLIDSARKAGVERFIFISAFGAGPNHPVDFFRVKWQTEEYLKNSGLSYTILRPTAFMEVWGAMIGAPILTTGKTTIYGPGSNPVNFISTEDVSRFVIIGLEDPQARNQTITIGGPRNMPMNEVAELFEETIHRKAQVSHVPLLMMKVMSPIIWPFNEGTGRIMAMAANLATDNWSLNMNEVLKKYPVKLIPIEEVVHKMVETTPA